MKKRKVIDWLTMTGHENDKVLDYIPEGFEIGEKLHPVKRYPIVYELKPSGKLYIGSDDRQGNMFQWTGEDLKKIRDAKLSAYDVLLLLQQYAYAATRIDYAVDIFEPINPDHLHDYWVCGMVNTRIKTQPDRVMKTRGGGYTCYYGARTGDKFLRVYDKAAQLKLLNEAWVRVEYQTRKKVATAFGQDLELDGLKNGGDAAVKRFIDFPDCPWWRKAIDGESEDHTDVPRKDEAWQMWFDGQVMPALQRRADESPENRDWLKNWAVRAVNYLYSDAIGSSANGTSDKEGKNE